MNQSQTNFTHDFYLEFVEKPMNVIRSTLLKIRILILN